MGLKNIDESDHVICAFLDYEPGHDHRVGECHVVVRDRRNRMRIVSIKSHEFSERMHGVTKIAVATHQVLLNCIQDLRFAAEIEREKLREKWKEAAKAARGELERSQKPGRAIRKKPSVLPYEAKKAQKGK